MANFIPEDKIREVRNCADIVEVVSEAVLLKRAGKDYVGLCPFHTEKTPSFTVSPDKQMFYCFGCSEGGDVITFIRKYEGLSYPEAVKKLAGRYGIQIPMGAMSTEQRRRISARDRLIEANTAAASFYRQSLLKSPGGRPALAYLSRRGLTDEIIRRYVLGFAPDRWDGLTRYLPQKKVSAPVAESAGLIIARKNGRGHYDRFRNRIIFPIFSSSRTIIGFGGRVMDDSLPKYLNSPETDVFNKRRSLYGLDRARQASRSAGCVYVVEGYFDVLALHQHGFVNAVATLGTSLTDDHVQTLRGLVGTSGKAVLVFDSDTAGIRAAKRSIQVFDRAHLDAHILVLPEGHDPDSFLGAFGAAAFDRAVAKARGAFLFLLASAISEHGLSIEGKMHILSNMADPLVSVSDRVKRSLCVKEIAEKLDVSEQDILARVRKKSGLRPDTIVSPSTADNRIERQIVSMMFQFPEILATVEALDALNCFQDAALQTIGREILKHREDEATDARDVIDGLAGKGLDGKAAALTFGDPAWHPQGCIRLIERFADARRRHRDARSIDERIRHAEKTNDQVLLNRLLGEKQQLAVKNEQKKMAFLNRKPAH